MSQSVDKVVATLGVGDTIKTTRTHKVYSVLDNGVGTEDVQSGVRFWIGTGIDHGSLKVELVKKAKPKVKVGDILTSAQVQDHQWKRGTVLECAEYVFVLDGHGIWLSPSHPEDLNADTDTFTFEDLSYESNSFTVIYLP